MLDAPAHERVAVGGGFETRPYEVASRRDLATTNEPDLTFTVKRARLAY